MTTIQGAADALDYAESRRRSLRLPRKQQLEQYFSSASLARLMASMMNYGREVRILDPGAGAGALFSACVEAACRGRRRPDRVDVTAYEIDPLLAEGLAGPLDDARMFCEERNVEFSSKIVRGDFISYYTNEDIPSEFTHVIMNPPYSKINSKSKIHKRLQRAGLPTSNMYAAFIAISQRVLDNDGGQMTFISPRSFCNGSYFERFRKDLLGSMSIQRIHLFDSRTSSFRDDDVLQENVIMCARKGSGRRNAQVTVSTSAGPTDAIRLRKVDAASVVCDGDPRSFIHIVPDEEGSGISELMRGLGCTLADLDIQVSTGKVVDFRIRDELRHDRSGSPLTVPLVRPFNISDGTVSFPLDHKHPNYITNNYRSRRLLVPNGNYVLVKRFTAPEEQRRVVAAVWAKEEYDASEVGFENRINYFHADGMGLEMSVARGLWVFLNSAVVDAYFRQFNGSTQVNASDLRYLRYPNKGELERLGSIISNGHYPNQTRIDVAMERMFVDA